MKRGIRHRLITVMLLGVVTAALSLVALVRVLSLTAATRIERAREAVLAEADHLAAAAPDEARSLVHPPVTFVGMRGGYTTHGAPPDVPPEWRAALESASASARAGGPRVVNEPAGDGATLVLCVRPVDAASYVWVGYLVTQPAYHERWRRIVVMLAVATALLVTSALYAVVTVKRGAADLNASLVALAHDLSFPIPRPSVRELSDVADGIAGLAAKLARAREEQERMGRELAQQERMAALGRVVAGVAHEVRNPLASIKLRLELSVSSGPALPPAAAKAVAHATAEIVRLDRLVADLLVVAGGAAGPRQPTALGPLVHERVDLLAPWSLARGIAIRARGEGSARVDADSIARALDNLLRNAVEASPPSGTVEVTVTPSAHEGGIAVRVEDSGAGVPVDRAAELFEPFFTTKAAGTGLGLAISRAIARAHGGDVTYARVGPTTRFELVVGGVTGGAGGA